MDRTHQTHPTHEATEAQSAGRSQRQSLSSTNLIESCFARTEAWSRRVKRWRNAKMMLRWGTAALLVAEKGFRRIRGDEHLAELITALNQLQTKLAPLAKAA